MIAWARSCGVPRTNPVRCLRSRASRPFSWCLSDRGIIDRAEPQGDCAASSLCIRQAVSSRAAMSEAVALEPLVVLEKQFPGFWWWRGRSDRGRSGNFRVRRRRRGSFASVRWRGGAEDSTRGRRPAQLLRATAGDPQPQFHPPYCRVVFYEPRRKPRCPSVLGAWIGPRRQ